MIRYLLVEGDRTPNGGVVIEGLSTYTIDGRAVAYHGARIQCPACKSMGVLRCVGPRRPHTLPNGQQVGLENDLCICKCRPPPKLISSQRLSRMDADGSYADDDDGDGQARPADALAAAVAADSAAGYRKRFLMRDSESGKPLSNRKFIVCIGSSTQDGVTDGDGYAYVDAPPGQAVELHLIFESPRRLLKQES